MQNPSTEPNVTPDTAGIDAINSQSKYLFDIAFSYAGEDRRIAKELAESLTERGYKVFYDDFHQHESWGRDLAEFLGEIYENSARYCLLITSKTYPTKFWTSHELRHAQARQLRQPEGYILQLRLDSTEIPGIPSTIGYIDYSTSAKAIDLLAKKLGTPIPQSSEDIGRLLTLAVELAERKIVAGLSLILREKLEPYAALPEFAGITASFATRLCKACGETSGQLHEEISDFLTSHNAVTFPILVNAYPQGVPCSLSILSKSPTPAAIELFKRIVKEEKQSEAWRIAVSTLSDKRTQQGEQVLIEAFKKRDVDPMLVRALLNLSSRNANQVLAQKLRTGAKKDRTIILNVARGVKVHEFRPVLEQMLDAGEKDEQVLEYLNEIGSEKLKRIEAEMQAALEKPKLDQTRQWLKSKTVRQIASELENLDRRISELSGQIYERDISPDDREQGFEFPEDDELDELTDERRRILQLLQDVADGMPKNQYTQTDIRRILRILNNRK